MLIFFGFFIHLVFLVSIFDIYFKSPVITGVTSYTPLNEGPASRLILFVADGLRFDSLVKTMEAPYLKSIMATQGSWGVSHTRVPTESRPGHVALIAGFYEDPSAIAKGWKENPVDFDSIFNQSRYTWSWGSPDILPMFAKGATGDHVETNFYSHEEETFSGKESTSNLDTWVFDKVEEFFENAKNDVKLSAKLKEDKIILFLHLLGLDTAGHTHKPNSGEFEKNIKVVNDGISKIQEIIEEFYDRDQKTAFIFTADHGMTDWGSHGAGSDHETKTPLIAWGAGIATPSFISTEENTLMKSKNRMDVDQADICPLMAALLGIATPVNSVGILPESYLGTDIKIKAQSLYSNARQMMAQYDRKREIIDGKMFSGQLRPFINLTHNNIMESIISIENLISEGEYLAVMKISKALISLSLLGLDYYQNFYQGLLLNCMTMSYLGWIWWLLTVLLQGVKTNENLEKSPFSSKKSSKLARHFIHIIFGVLISLSLLLIYAQELPPQYYIYCSMPLFLWWKNVLSLKLWLEFFKNINNNTNSSVLFCLIKRTVLILVYLAGIAVLVLSFFHRWALSIGLVGLSMFPLHESYRKNISKSLLLSWITSCISLAGFSFLPVIGQQDDIHLVGVSGLSWFICGLIFLSVFSLPMLKYSKETKRENVAMAAPCLMMLLAIQNKYLVSYQFSNKKGLPIFCQVLSWALAVASFLVPMFSSRWMISRLFSIKSCLAVFFILLSVSHEGFFLMMLAINLFCWLAIEHHASGLHQGMRLSQLSFIESKPINMNKITSIDRTLKSDDFRCAYIFLLYIILAFFGTGNIASINSFDPQWVRAFVSQFSPFLMTGLILCKTLVPFLCVACSFCAVNKVIKAPTGQLFLIVMVFSDLMGLCFLHLVTNKGSWLDIGSSISHYVIMETTVLFLYVLYCVGQVLTETSVWNLKKPISQSKVSKD